MRFNTGKIIGLFSIFFLAWFPWVLTQNYKYPFDEDSRDPLYPLIDRGGQILIPKEASASDFTLQGVIYSQNGSRAVISREILEQGDSIRGYTVLKIDEGRVVLEKNGEEFILKLEEE